MIDPKLIRKLGDELERTFHTLQDENLSQQQRDLLEIEETELVRLLENLYMDRHPEFINGHENPLEEGKYIPPEP